MEYTNSNETLYKCLVQMKYHFLPPDMSMGFYLTECSFSFSLQLCYSDLSHVWYITATT